VKPAPEDFPAPLLDLGAQFTTTHDNEMDLLLPLRGQVREGVKDQEWLLFGDQFAGEKKNAFPGANSQFGAEGWTLRQPAACLRL
jgi:hypothetical protein